ncbi:hypothetical protein SLS58_008605 [Diplodia intermedia]|uniref:NAD-dependent epimerase/dehydratase domain-containing protein n=1 Tax=Diplodia intermedia TaxID=856260 RepID=A0ABR3TH81_9PEZI
MPPPPPLPPLLTLPTPPALPPGSTILVTGANGLIASHICDLLLAQGHHVRGAVRSLTRSAWLATLLAARHGADAFTLIEVPDMAAPGAFDAAMRGVQGVAHVASVMLSADGEEDAGAVVRGTVGGVREVLGAVGRVGGVGGVRRVVFVPSGVFGRPLSHEHQGYPSSSQWAPKAFTGDPDFKRFPTFYWINIKDMARLHVAALLHPEVKNERIFGFAGTYTMNEFLAFYRKHYPDREFPEDIPGVECDLAEIEPAKRAEELLKEMGRPGYETLEDTVLDNIIDIA